MTDNEIIKALTICSTKGASCKDCPAFVKVDRSNCKKVLLGALDLINRLQAENENLKDILYDAEGVNLVNYWYQQCKIAENGCKNFAQENKNLKADIKRLRNHIQEGAVLAKQIPEMMELAKAEAYKECIEKMKEYIDTHEHLSCEECECVPISKDGLDNLLKELVGEEK